jgi:molecular chaperone GrpE
VPSWFKRAERPDEDQAESTIEVKAEVIADAVRAGNSHDSRDQQSGIAVDGVIAGGEFEVADEPDQNGAESIEEGLINQALSERRSLVQLCLYALDRARSAGVSERIEEGLAAVGVQALRPDGQKFDPTYHEAGGTVATEDDALDGVVAETEVVGFSDRGEVLRVPIVTVYSRSATS